MRVFGPARKREFAHALEPVVDPAGWTPEDVKRDNSFDATVKDPDFLADAKRAKLDILPVELESVTKMMANHAAPPDIVAPVRQILAGSAGKKIKNSKREKNNDKLGKDALVSGNRLWSDYGAYRRSRTVSG